jgi:hypothetical protein
MAHQVFLTGRCLNWYTMHLLTPAHLSGNNLISYFIGT